MSSGGGSSKTTVGHKYYAGMHMALCHGPADKLVRIRVGGKDAWIGSSAGGSISVSADNLFGGDKREGGISGQVDLAMGAPSQGQNSYLAAKLGSSLLPAFRGVVCAILRQVYIGMNPYAKDWGWLLQRVHKRKNGEAQWYDEKAEINAYSVTREAIPYVSTPVVLLEPGSAMWSYVVDPVSNPDPVTSEDLSGFGAFQAPFAKNLPLPGWFFNELPYGRAWKNSGLFTYAPEELGYTRWHAKLISLVNLSRVYIEVKGGDNTAVYIDDVLWDGSPIYPTKKSMKLTISTFTMSGLSYYNYIDAMVWQFEERVDPGASGIYADMNPAHIIRECLTDPNWGMGYPESDIDDESFAAAADALYSEKMGISILWSQQASIEDFVADILRHIDAALYVDRSTGKFVLRLVRADYDPADLPVLDSSNISRVENYTKQTLAELANEVTLTYNSNESGQLETVTLQNLAMIQQQGAIIPASVEYLGFANEATALQVAARDLIALSTPLVTATITANREASGLNVGDPFLWEWAESGEDGTGVATAYIMRVTEIAFGDGVDNAVRIECAQDVFALPAITYVEAEETEWQDPSVAPLPALPRLVAEAPYYELVRRLGETEATSRLSTLPELGILLVAAGRQGAELNATIHVDSGAGYAESNVMDFCPCASLGDGIGYLDTEIPVLSISDFEDVEPGSLAQLGDEIVVVEAVVEGVATVRRGCLDSVPARHAASDTLIAWDGLAVSDELEYVSSDEVSVKIATVSGRGVLPLVDAPADSVTMAQRALRPYPPANVLVNGEGYPPVVLADAGNIVVTWAHRDRTQQTGAEILGWTDSSVGPEAGVTYGARLIRTDTEVILQSSTGLSGTTVTFTTAYRGQVRLEVWSVRSGLASLFKYTHTFEYADSNVVFFDGEAVFYNEGAVYYEL